MSLAQILGVREGGDRRTYEGYSRACAPSSPCCMRTPARLLAPGLPAPPPWLRAGRPRRRSAWSASQASRSGRNGGAAT